MKIHLITTDLMKMLTVNGEFNLLHMELNVTIFLKDGSLYKQVSAQHKQRISLRSTAFIGTMPRKAIISPNTKKNRRSIVLIYTKGVKTD
jgi:hypothetical protein